MKVTVNKEIVFWFSVCIIAAIGLLSCSVTYRAIVWQH